MTQERVRRRIQTARTTGTARDFLARRAAQATSRRLASSRRPTLSGALARIALSSRLATSGITATAATRTRESTASATGLPTYRVLLTPLNQLAHTDGTVDHLGEEPSQKEQVCRRETLTLKGGAPRDPQSVQHSALERCPQCKYAAAVPVILNRSVAQLEIGLLRQWRGCVGPQVVPEERTEAHTSRPVQLRTRRAVGLMDPDHTVAAAHVCRQQVPMVAACVHWQDEHIDASRVVCTQLPQELSSFRGETRTCACLTPLQPFIIGVRPIERAHPRNPHLIKRAHCSQTTRRSEAAQRRVHHIRSSASWCQPNMQSPTAASTHALRVLSIPFRRAMPYLIPPVLYTRSALSRSPSTLIYHNYPLYRSPARPRAGRQDRRRLC